MFALLCDVARQHASAGDACAAHLQITDEPDGSKKGSRKPLMEYLIFISMMLFQLFCTAILGIAIYSNGRKGGDSPE